MNEMNKQRSEQVFGGVFLIGLALLFLTGWWWPGVMFVIGGAIIARGLVQGIAWTANRDGLVVIGIGMFFVLLNMINIFSFNWLPLILIGLGVWLLFGDEIRARAGWEARTPAHRDEFDTKPKNDEVV